MAKSVKGQMYPLTRQSCTIPSPEESLPLNTTSHKTLVSLRVVPWSLVWSDLWIMLRITRCESRRRWGLARFFRGYYWSPGARNHGALLVVRKENIERQRMALNWCTPKYAVRYKWVALYIPGQGSTTEIGESGGIIDLD